MRKYIIPALLTVLAINVASAKPAMKGTRTVVQPDGSKLEIVVTGDEHFHYVTTPDGALLCEDADGFYRLAKVASDGAFESTGISPYSADADKVAFRPRAAQLRAIREALPSRRNAPQSGKGLTSNTYPHFGSPRGLIILVQYQDIQFRPVYNANEYFNDMINGENFTQYGATGSALKYFTDQSHGQFTPQFDVYGPVTLPNNRAYYGRNDRWGSDTNPHLMVSDAIKILDPDVDFSLYDTDGDGLIDNVFVFYAGQGEADYGPADSVWPHSWDVRSGGVNLTVDGVKVAHYACSNEWNLTSPEGIGTFVHEFSHVMGLPDLYNTAASVFYTPGSWSVLDYGPYNNNGRTPPNYGAYELNAMGWAEPQIIEDAVTVTLNPISSHEFALIPANGDTEFFLFENRQQEGWDEYLPNHGMLIWHVDYVPRIFENGLVNNNQSHQYVDIEEANNNPNYYPDGNTEAGYPFPGTTGKTSFTATTTPALKSWAGKAIDLPVTDITEVNGIITFDVAGGGFPFYAPEPSVAEVSETERYFTASWQPVEGATDYYLTVNYGDNEPKGSLEESFDGSTLESGWTASATSWYTTFSNFGEASPSYKFGTNTQSLTSASTPADITSIEFWIKGQSTSDTHLKIEGLQDGKWILIANHTPLTNIAETVTIDNIPEGVRQIRFVMNKSQGNIALDDIVINYGGAVKVLPNYNMVSTGGATSMRVDKLLDNIGDYFFTVTSTDGTRLRTSKPVSVSVGIKESGVEAIENPEVITPEYFNLQGVRISQPVKGIPVIEKRGNSIRKIIVK